MVWTHRSRANYARGSWGVSWERTKTVKDVPCTVYHGRLNFEFREAPQNTIVHPFNLGLHCLHCHECSTHVLGVPACLQWQLPSVFVTTTVKKRGEENLTKDTPLKIGFWTPFVWYTFQPSLVSSLCLSCTQLRLSRPEAHLEGCRYFLEGAFCGTFSFSTYVLHPPPPVQ